MYFLDSNKRVFFYGDSYSGTSYFERWPYQAATMNCDFLVNGLTGGNSKEMFFQCVLDLSRFHKPDVILWGLGMNDPVDTTELSVNYTQYVNGLKHYCDSLGITIIPCTIPSVPSRNHEMKNNFIRTNYLRYVDFAKAVENGVDHSWIPGTLTTDNIHPTEYGAFLLAVQAMSDCPELYK